MDVQPNSQDPNSPDQVEAVVAFADKPTAEHMVMSASVLRSLHDGVRFFWIEERQCLLFRGKTSDLQKSNSGSGSG